MSNVNENRHAYFVGGGMASLAGACFLIRDCDFPGKNIHILEDLALLGGSTDGAGSPRDGYIMRGGRMLNDETYENTWDLFSSIPSLTDPKKSVRQEIIEFDTAHPTRARARLVDKNGMIVDVDSMGFNNIDRLEMVRLILATEESLGTLRINDKFSHHFFKTNFWYMWATTFAFQPWHSAVEFRRYMLRFMHEFPRIHTLAGVTRTPYNQYDSLIRPMQKYLGDHGVDFNMKCTVTDMDFAGGAGITVTALHFTKEGKTGTISMNPGDMVYLTNGSMTDSSSLGSMTSVPSMNGKGSAWKLWDTLAAKKSALGRPSSFDGDIEATNWESFTVTCQDSRFFDLMEQFSGNAAGSGALVTFKDSAWFMSIVLAYQPHFIGQPDGIKVFWGYGLYTDKPGDLVKKPMRKCTGAEILDELLFHLKFIKNPDEIKRSLNCIPCMMPFITSQFMPRAAGDRPAVIPEGSTNLACISQFCEIPDDVVFTEEYSVRAARIAVYSMMKVSGKTVAPLNQYQFDTKTIFAALQTSFR